jgi:hypothetical protein
MTGLPDLAERAAKLVAECDRARFAREDHRPDEILQLAREFFRDLGRTRFKKGGKSAGGKTERGTPDRVR